MSLNELRNQRVAVVIVARNKTELSDLKSKFTAGTTLRLEELAWLRILDLRLINAIAQGV